MPFFLFPRVRRGFFIAIITGEYYRCIDADGCRGCSCKTPDLQKIEAGNKIRTQIERDGFVSDFETGRS